VATEAAALARPLLVGLDVDGVLAPIVEHADDARLLPEVGALVAELARLTPVAIVSGRSVAGLERFAFADAVEVIGSHGMEWRAGPELELVESERARLDTLAALADDAAAAAGDGAWVEHKPAAVAVHVRGAAADRARRAVDDLLRRSSAVHGAEIKLGHEVVELLARTTSKATAITEVRARHRAAAVVFVGDDRTDEEVFAALGAGDCSVRVGPGPTVARHRLADPHAVLDFLSALRDLLAQAS
jgi:trehalose-phosphatase